MLAGAAPSVVQGAGRLGLSAEVAPASIGYGLDPDATAAQETFALSLRVALARECWTVMQTLFPAFRLSPGTIFAGRNLRCVAYICCLL